MEKFSFDFQFTLSLSLHLKPLRPPVRMTPSSEVNYIRPTTRPHPLPSLDPSTPVLFYFIRKFRLVLILSVFVASLLLSREGRHV